MRRLLNHAIRLALSIILTTPLVGCGGGKDVRVSRERDAGRAKPQAGVIHVTDFNSSRWSRDWDVLHLRDIARLDEPTRGFKPLDEDALRVRVGRGRHYGVDFRYDFDDELDYEPEEIYFRYYIQFADDWNPDEGGKLPGFGGTYGDAGSGGARSDGRNGWSARGFYGVAKGGVIPIGSYCYNADMRGDFGDSWVWSVPGGGLVRNRWYCVEQYCKLNTPGRRDGVLRAWVDGRPVFEKRDIRFRDTPKLKIEFIWVQVYHGGRKVARRNHHLYLDDLVISADYIGPRD